MDDEYYDDYENDPASYNDEFYRRERIIETGGPYDEENDIGPGGEWPWQEWWE